MGRQLNGALLTHWEGGLRNSLSSLQNYWGGRAEGWRLLCPWAQPPALIPSTNQARGASLSPTFPQTCLLAPHPIPLQLSLAQEEREAYP